MNKPKVFCIGFHKTGTTSLDTALRILGYRVTGPDRDLAVTLMNGDYNPVWAIVEQFDAFQDNPWPILFKELDARYPGSKFILTRRDPEKWMASMINHFDSRTSLMRQWIYGELYGAPKGNEKIYLDRFKRHYLEVEKHFKKRPNDLLLMDVAAGSGWKELCDFLGEEIPETPFPHSNKRSYSPVIKWLKRIGIR